jgi:hypothetical protein
MAAAPSAIDPTPWPAAAYASVFARHTRHTYSASFGGWSGATGALTLWNVHLTIDENGSPSGRLDADLSTADAALLDIRNPRQYVEVATGYDGLAQARIFAGHVAEIEDGPLGVSHLVAVSSESPLDTVPSASSTYTVGGTLTTMAQVVSALQGVYTWGNVPLRVIQIGSLTAPSTYVPFRQQSMESTDSLLDFSIACANSLGQWLRGDQRARANSGFISGTTTGTYDRSRLILSDRWDSGTPIDLTPITEKWSLRRSTDDFAHGVAITANYKSGKKQVTQTEIYWGAYFGNDSPLIKELSITYRPGAAFTAGTDRVAQRWADSYAARTWRLTATCRAVWWLEPGMRATVGTTTGTITKLTYDIDQGVMTVELRPTVTWIPA